MFLHVSDFKNTFYFCYHDAEGSSSGSLQCSHLKLPTSCPTHPAAPRFVVTRNVWLANQIQPISFQVNWKSRINTKNSIGGFIQCGHIGERDKEIQMVRDGEATLERWGPARHCLRSSLFCKVSHSLHHPLTSCLSPRHKFLFWLTKTPLLVPGTREIYSPSKRSLGKFYFMENPFLSIVCWPKKEETHISFECICSSWADRL